MFYGATIRLLKGSCEEWKASCSEASVTKGTRYPRVPFMKDSQMLATKPGAVDRTDNRLMTGQASTISICALNPKTLDSDPGT